MMSFSFKKKFTYTSTFSCLTEISFILYIYDNRNVRRFEVLFFCFLVNRRKSVKEFIHVHTPRMKKSVGERKKEKQIIC